MKNKLQFIMLMIFLMSHTAFSSSSNIFQVGTYSYTQQGDELIDGRRASITWNIELKDNRNAVVSISSWHAPFTCDGVYTISSEKDYVALSWSSKDNKDSECDTPSPQILLKESSAGNMLIRSELFPWNNDDWKNLRKIG